MRLFHFFVSVGNFIIIISKSYLVNGYTTIFDLLSSILCSGAVMVFWVLGLRSKDAWNRHKPSHNRMHSVFEKCWLSIYRWGLSYSVVVAQSHEPTALAKMWRTNRDSSGYTRHLFSLPKDPQHLATSKFLDDDFYRLIVYVMEN